jgi:molybdenum cofactor cytidylyltransferase
MGSPKALLSWGSSSIVESLIQELRKAGPGQVVLIVGTHADEIRRQVDSMGVGVCYHPEWRKGMGSSIAAGIRYIESEFPKAGSVLISLCDQPFLGVSQIKILLAEHKAFPHLIVASAYESGPGAPAIFPREYWNSLKTLPADSGAKAYLRQHRNSVRVVEIGKATMDVDTPEAYKKALAIYRSNQTNNLNK